MKRAEIHNLCLVRLQGVLMDSNEFICAGKSIVLTDKEIERYVIKESEVAR